MSGSQGTLASLSKEEARPRSTSALEDLPVEIMYSITDLLRVSSSCSLSICNRSLAQLLGPRYWPCLRQGNDDKIQFLRILVRDFPGQYACITCKRLHPTDKVQWPASLPTEQPLTCVKIAEGYILDLKFGEYLIKFVYVQLALENHRLGARHGIPIEAFNHTEFRIHRDDRVRSILSVEARVDSDELLLRSQKWIWLPQHRKQEFMDGKYMDRLCLHVFMRRTPPLNDILTGNLKILLAGGQTEVTSCTVCRMEFFVEILDFDRKGCVLSTIRWINFGKGINYSDSDWRCHLPAPRSTYSYTPTSEDSIKDRFEGQPGRSCEENEIENLQYLFWRPGLSRERLWEDGMPGFTRRMDYRGEPFWYRPPVRGRSGDEEGDTPLWAMLVSPVRSLYQILCRFFGVQV